MNKIFLICGKKRSGKDTLGSTIIEFFKENGREIIRESFAKPIKNYISQLLNISEDEIETYKDGEFEGFNEGFIRNFLIKIGMGSREVYNDCFVDRIINTLNRDYNYVITDCRFFNELYKIKTVATHQTIVIYTLNREVDKIKELSVAERELIPIHSRMSKLYKEIDNKEILLNMVKINDPLIDYLFINDYIEKPNEKTNIEEQTESLEKKVRLINYFKRALNSFLQEILL